MPIENFEEVQKYITENMDKDENIKNYVSGFVTQDRVSNFLNTEDGKRFLQPTLDAYHSKGLKSWQDNNLDKLYKERYAKEHPSTDPKDQAIAKMQAKLDKMENDAKMKDLTNSALQILGQKQLPLELIDMLGTNEEVVNANIAKLEAVFASTVNKMVEEKLKGTTPKAGGGGTPDKNPWSKEHLNYTEQGRILRENPVLASQLMAQAK